MVERWVISFWDFAYFIYFQGRAVSFNTINLIAHSFSEGFKKRPYVSFDKDDYVQDWAEEMQKGDVF